MQFRLAVPEGVKAGQIVQASANGMKVKVRVPKEARPGDWFQFELRTEESVSSPENQTAQQQPQHHHHKSSALHKHDSNARASILEGTLLPKTTTMTYTDLGRAICLGMALGLSLVVGFIMGILRSTEPLDFDTEE